MMTLIFPYVVDQIAFWKIYVIECKACGDKYVVKQVIV